MKEMLEAVMDKDATRSTLRPLGFLTFDERTRLVGQLCKLIERVKKDLGAAGRADLIVPMHNLFELLRVISVDVAGSEAFCEVVAAVAQLVRTVKAVDGTSAPSNMVH